MNTLLVKKNILLFLLTAVLVIGSLGFANPILAGDVRLNNPLSAAGVNDFPQLISRIVRFIRDLVGALAVLMLVVAGIFFVLAGANPENVNKAKQIALYAVIGLAIALAGTGLIQVVTVVIGAPT